jgi:dihydrofolate reductase
MKARVALIVAMTADRLIGVGGKLPWKLAADMHHFKKTTMGCPVIMGRRTWESIGKPLRGRMNIVLTTNEGYEVPGGYVARSTRQALQLARRGIIENLAASFSSPAEEIAEPLVMIIGGEAVYRAFLPVAERIYQTLVHADLQGDTHFPHLDAAEWTVSRREDHVADDRNPHDYSFVVLDRKVTLEQESTAGVSRQPEDPPRDTT